MGGEAPSRALPRYAGEGADPGTERNLKKLARSFSHSWEKVALASARVG